MTVGTSVDLRDYVDLHHSRCADADFYTYTPTESVLMSIVNITTRLPYSRELNDISGTFIFFTSLLKLIQTMF